MEVRNTTCIDWSLQHVTCNVVRRWSIILSDNEDVAGVAKIPRTRAFVPCLLYFYHFSWPQL